MKALPPSLKQIGCAGKVRFGSFARANKVASKTAHRRGRKFQPYACDLCGGFHIGNAIGGNKQRGGLIDPRKPYLVHARDRTGTVCVIGRSGQKDGGDLRDVLALDGWEITKVTKVR